MKVESVKVKVDPLGPRQWHELAVTTTTGWIADQPIYAYVESIRECALFCQPLRETLTKIATATPGMIEGRFFDHRCDVRWIRRPSGEFDAWLTREVADGGIHVEPVRRRYYLHGTYSSRAGAFCEARYPNRTFVYPHHDDMATQDGDRAWIDVVEYMPAPPPQWTELTTEDEIRMHLNQPMVVGHRFVGFGVGRDSPEKGESTCHPRSA